MPQRNNKEIGEAKAFPHVSSWESRERKRRRGGPPQLIIVSDHAEILRKQETGADFLSGFFLASVGENYDLAPLRTCTPFCSGEPTLKFCKYNNIVPKF